MNTKAKLILSVQGSKSLSESDFLGFMTSQPLAGILYPLYGEDINRNLFWAISPDKMTSKEGLIFSQEPDRAIPLLKGNYGMHSYSSDLANVILELVSSNKINFNLCIEKKDTLAERELNFRSFLKPIVEILRPAQVTFGFLCSNISGDAYTKRVGSINLEGYGYVRTFVDLITYFSPLMVETIGKIKFDIAAQSPLHVEDYQDGVLTEIVNPLESTNDLCQNIYFQKIGDLIRVLGLDKLVVT